MDIKPNILLEVLPIDDMYGPTIHRDCFQCLVVSQETESAVDAVNAMRKERVGIYTVNTLISTFCFRCRCLEVD